MVLPTQKPVSRFPLIAALNVLPIEESANRAPQRSVPKASNDTVVITPVTKVLRHETVAGFPLIPVPEASIES